jgi:HSP20 family protein
MDFVKQTKEFAESAGNTIEKGIDTAKEGFSNVISHLPFTNIFKKNDALKLEIDLPGVKKEDIELSIENERLNVTARRYMKNEVKKEDYYLQESAFGLISRTFSLPDDIDHEKIDAKYENGRLFITLEKEEAKKPRNIVIY